MRRDGIDQQAFPHPYIAEYVGHKLHLEQNDKSFDYEVAVVCAVDCYSKFITRYSVMSNKIM